MKRYVAVFVTFLVVADVERCCGLPGGAPTGACNTFTPRHADRDNQGTFISPQSRDSSPYVLRMSRTNFTADVVIRVWVSDTRMEGDTGYRGILLQARRNRNFDDGPIGQWEKPPDSTKQLKCSAPSDAVTHSDVTTVKNSDTVFQWRAPCALDTGDIMFIATVAQSRERFWVNISSEVVSSKRAVMLDCSSDKGLPAVNIVAMFIALVANASVYIILG